VKNLGINAQEHAAGEWAPVQRLPYRSPVLVEYGSVSKLTEGQTVGSAPDYNSMGMRMS
jgi:hypothetical protein